MEGFRDNVLICPELNTDSISTGIDPVTGLDPLGFDSLGNYKFPPYPGYQNGDPFDPKYNPRGFGSDSTYLNTGSRYDPNGCDINGLDSLGNDCNGPNLPPYYWLYDNPPTKEGLDFYDERRSSLGNDTRSGIDTLIQELTDSMSLFNCDSLRILVKNIVSQTEMNADYILGKNNEFINEGMSSKFKEKPRELSMDQNNRNEQISNLEKEHVHVYDCEILLKELEVQIERLQNLSSSEFNQLKEYIKNQMLTIKKEELDSMESYAIWIRQQISEFLENSDDLSEAIPNFKVNDFNPSRSEHPTKFKGLSNKNTGTLTASISNNYLVRNEREVLEDMLFYYDQGFNYIEGIPRAYIVRELAHANNKRTLNSNSIFGDQFPVELHKEVLGADYYTYFDNFRISTSEEGAKIDAFFVLESAVSDEAVAFSAENISLGTNGIGSDTITLSLLGNSEIKINDVAQLRLKGNSDPNQSRTFVKVACDGFAGIAIDADVEFCSEYFYGVQNGKADPSYPVIASLYAEAISWPEIYGELNVPEFALASDTTYRFEVEQATIDFSTQKSLDASSIASLPRYYSADKANELQDPNWVGFYLGQLRVSFNNPFKKNETSEGGVRHVIIDDQGFSGEFFTYKLVPLDESNANGWKVSLDTLNVGFHAHRLANSYIAGDLLLPISDGLDHSKLHYSGTLSPGFNFDLDVRTFPKQNVPMFKGVIDISGGSYLNISNSEEFFIKAHLNGSLNVNELPSISDRLEVKDITFTGVEISNLAPYFSPGSWKIGSVGMNLGNFSFSLDTIEFKKPANNGNNDEVVLSMNINAEVASKVDLNGGTRLHIFGELNSSGGIQRWEYKSANIDKIYVEGSW